MEINEKIEKAKKYKIYIDESLTKGLLSGVYGFFAINADTEYCFYIGKAICIYDRIFGSSNGHIHYFLNSKNGKYVKPKEKKIVEDIESYLQSYGRVELRLLEKVDMNEETYERAAHKLALAEYLCIDKYQQKGQCLHQLPEGAENSRRYWEENLKEVIEDVD